MNEMPNQTLLDIINGNEEANSSEALANLINRL